MSAEAEKEAKASLLRIQGFDPKTLVREADLGKTKAFYGVVTPAQRLIDLYNRLSPDALQDFPEGKLNEVKERANSDYQLFVQIENFDADSTTADRDALIHSVEAAYGTAFLTLHALIAYSLHRSADFQRLDSQARATLQSIKDRGEELMAELSGGQGEVVRIIEQVRAAAAEAGVSQQAHYFKVAAETHEKEAASWRRSTIRFSWLAGGFAFLSLFSNHIPLLAPTNAYEAAQIAVSKFLLFGVLAFLLFLAARNFLSHKHNAVVNQHRQQALQTYKALVEAAMDSANRDIVLTHAASCIFGPQPTGYTGVSSPGAPSEKSVIELLGTGIGRADS